MTKAMGKGGAVTVRPAGLFPLLALTAGASEKNFRGKVASGELSHPRLQFGRHCHVRYDKRIVY